MSKYFTKEVTGNIKRAKYQVKNAQGNYEVVYLETAADQVEETHDRVFVTPEQKAQITSNKEAIEAEVQARTEAVEGLDSRLDVIEGTGEGSVKKALQDAKSYTDGKVTEINAVNQELAGKVSANEKAIQDLDSKVDTTVEEITSEFAGEISRVEGAFQAADTAIKGRLDSLEGKTADLETIRTNIAKNASDIAQEVSNREAAVKEVDDKLTAEVTRATAAEVALGKRIDGVESTLASEIKETKEYVDGKVSEINNNHNELAERVTANEGQLGLVDNKIETAATTAVNTSKTYTDGQVSSLRTALEAADVQVLRDAKVYTDEKVLESKTALEGKITSEVSTLNGTISTLSGRVSTNESDIANLKSLVSNKNNNTVVVDTQSEIAGANPKPKEGDLAFAVEDKRAFIFNGTEWVVFDEITNELDLKDYLKSADAASTYRRLDTAIVEGDLHTNLSTKINNKADKSYVDGELDKKADITYVDGQISTVNGLVNNNKTAIENEVTARKAAITSVETAIGTETTNRTQAINTVTSAINTEIADRKEAINTVNSTISGVDAKVAKEVSDREKAISDVETTIANEVKDIETAMSNETTRVNALIETLNSKIAQADALIVTLQTKLSTLEEIETNRIVFDK